MIYFTESVVYVVVQSHHVYARIPVLYVQVDFISFTGAAGAAAPRDADIIVCARPANVFTGGMWMCNWSPLYSCAGYTSSISGGLDDPIKWSFDTEAAMLCQLSLLESTFFFLSFFFQGNRILLWWFHSAGRCIPLPFTLSSLYNYLVHRMGNGILEDWVS